MSVMNQVRPKRKSAVDLIRLSSSNYHYITSQFNSVNINESPSEDLSYTQKLTSDKYTLD